MYNKVVLIGRLTAAPELKQTPSGTSVCSFTLAVNRRMSKENKADFLTVVAWKGTAEFVCKYFQKGSPIGVEGNIQTRGYEDRSGNKRTATEVLAEAVFFVGAKADAEARHSVDVYPGAGNQESQDYQEIEGEEDLPF